MTTPGDYVGESWSRDAVTMETERADRHCRSASIARASRAGGRSLSPVALLGWDADGLRVRQRLFVPGVVLAGVLEHPMGEDDVDLPV